MSDSEGVEHDGTARRSTTDPDGAATDRALAERLAAVEQAMTDEGPVADLSSTAERDRRLDDLSSRVEAVEDRLDELEAATQALRGYVGSVRAVNEEVERRADMALAIAERADEPGDHTSSSPSQDAEAPDERADPVHASGTTVGAADDDVAAAVGDPPARPAPDSGPAEPAVAAAVPDASDGTRGIDASEKRDEGDGSGRTEGVIARLRDVL